MFFSKEENYKKKLLKLIQEYNNIIIQPIKSVSLAIKDQKSRIKNQELKIEYLEGFVINLATEFEKKYESDLAVLNEKIQNKQTEKQKYENDLVKLIEDVQNKQTAKQKYESDLVKLTEDVQNKQTQIQTLKNNVSKLSKDKIKKDIKNLDKEIEKIENQKKQSKTNLENLNEYIKKLEVNLSKVQEKRNKKVNILTEELAKCEEKKKELEEKLKLIKEMSPTNNQIINLEEMKQHKSNIRNFIEKENNKKKQSNADETELINLRIKFANNFEKQLNLYLLIIAIKDNYSNDLNHSRNQELESSVILSAEENNVKNEPGLFKRIINLFSGGGKRIKKIYNQNKLKELDYKIEKIQAEINKLEAEKLSSFWNKFWIVISCGCYNNHGKVNRRINKRNLELEKSKKELEKSKKELENLTKSDTANNEPQPSTSWAAINQTEACNYNTKMVIKNGLLPKENSKKLISTLK